MGPLIHGPRVIESATREWEPSESESIQPGTSRRGARGSSGMPPAPGIVQRPHPVVGEAQDLVVRLLGGVAVLALVAYAAHSLLGLGGSGSALFENWVFNFLFFAGAALCLLRAL